MTDTPGWLPPTDGGDQPPQRPPAQPHAGGSTWGGQPPGYGAPPPTGQSPGWNTPGGGYGGQPGGPQQGYGPQQGHGPQPGYGPPPPGYGGYGQWGMAMAPKPGVIPLRPLGFGEILDGAFSVVRAYPKVTLGLSAIVVTITQLISFGVQAAYQVETGISPAFGTGDVTLILASLAASGINAIGLVMLAGMLTSVMGEAVLGRPITIGETWAKVRPRFWALLGAGIIGTVVPFLGLLLCILPGVFLWVAWSLATPALVLERVGVFDSIGRSYRLAVPDFWRIFGIRIVAVLITMILSAIITIPTTLLGLGMSLGSGDETGFSIAGLAIITVGGIIASTITAPFSSGLLALLYIDRRMRVEGLDVTLAQAAAAGTGTP